MRAKKNFPRQSRAIPTRPPPRTLRSRIRNSQSGQAKPRSHSIRPSTLFLEASRAFFLAARRDPTSPALRVLHRLLRGLDYLHLLSCFERMTPLPTPTVPWSPGGRYTAAHRTGSQRGGRSPQFACAVWIERLPAIACGSDHEPHHSASAVPAKGRAAGKPRPSSLRAPGLELVKPRGARRLRARSRPSLFEVRYLIRSLGRRDRRAFWRRHPCMSGLTVEGPRAREIRAADEHVVFLDGLGFGHAPNVVVAVPHAWIDVHNMATSYDARSPPGAFRLKSMSARCASPQITVEPHPQNFFSAHGRRH